MHKVLLAATAALVMTGSLANAQFLLYSNENDHKKVENLWATQSRAAQSPASQRYATPMADRGVTTATTTAGRVSPGFLIGETDNGHKRVINQYAR